MKTVYLYDENGEFTQEYEAQESPLEPGVYITPVQSTTKKPLVHQEGKAVVFNGDSWSRIDDNRGVWYKPNGESVEISSLADSIDESWVRELPPKDPRESMEVTAFQAKAAIARSGLYDPVVELMHHPDTPLETKLAWEEVLTFKRLSPTVLTMGAALGLTDSQLDDLFGLAATIEA